MSEHHEPKLLNQSLCEGSLAVVSIILFETVFMHGVSPETPRGILLRIPELIALFFVLRGGVPWFIYGKSRKKKK